MMRNLKRQEWLNEGYVSEMLIQNTTIYGILSKGIHELSEEECRKYFPVVKECIYQILGMWESERRKQADEDALIKALGRDGGVYVRVAGTTSLADEYMIKELLFEGSNRYYDQALCTGLNVTDEDIDALCKAMKEQAVRNARTEEQKASIKDVGRQQLRSWGILIERDGKDFPSNAFAILTGNGGLHVVTQCGVFKGTTKAVFVDRREYTGPLWEQIDEAFQFILINIHLSATIVGIYRQDVYEIPPDAIRELIINAMVHRSYLDHGTIQVAVYDNRLEITSPGKLPMALMALNVVPMMALMALKCRLIRNRRR